MSAFGGLNIFWITLWHIKNAWHKRRLNISISTQTKIIIYRTHTNRRRVYYFAVWLFGGSFNRIFSRGSFIGEGLVIPMKKEFGKGGLVLWYIIAYFSKKLTAIFFYNCIKVHNTFKLTCNNKMMLLKWLQNLLVS